MLLGFSILFYLERACYADIAFQTFTIINTKTTAHQLDRFGAVFIQIFPLAAVLLELPIQHILLTYSVALVAQNIFFFWLLHSVFKQKETALVLALFNVLLVTETFYWATNEVKQGFSFSILLAGVVQSMPLEKCKGIPALLLALLYLSLLVIIIFLHPVAVVAVAFLLVYSAAHSGRYFSATLVACAVITVAVLSVKYIFLPVNFYDSEQLSLRENFITHFPHYFSLPSFGKFFRYCVHDWYVYPMLVLAVTVYYFLKKKWLKLGVQIAFTAGYLVIVNVTHPDSEKMFIECYYQALAIFILFPFVTELLPALSTRYALLILAVIFALRLNTIFHTHHKYTKRLNLVRETLASIPGKFVIPSDVYPAQSGMMTWGIPYESALLSSIQSPDSCRSFAVLRDVSGVQKGERIFYTGFKRVHYGQLNPAYFRPVAQPYRVLSAVDIPALSTQ